MASTAAEMSTTEADVDTEVKAVSEKASQGNGGAGRTQSYSGHGTLAALTGDTGEADMAITKTASKADRSNGSAGVTAQDPSSLASSNATLSASSANSSINGHSLPSAAIIKDDGGEAQHDLFVTASAYPVKLLGDKKTDKAKKGGKTSKGKKAETEWMKKCKKLANSKCQALIYKMLKAKKDLGIDVGAVLKDKMPEIKKKCDKEQKDEKQRKICVMIKQAGALAEKYGGGKKMKSGTDGISMTHLIGAIVGGIVLLLLIIFLIYCCCCSGKSKKGGGAGRSRSGKSRSKRSGKRSTKSRSKSARKSRKSGRKSRKSRSKSKRSGKK